MFHWLKKQNKTRKENGQTGSLITSSLQNLVHQIQTLTGVTQADFKSLYITTIERFIEFSLVPNETTDELAVQKTLKQVVLALKRRRGYLLPLGADSETSFREREEWTFAVFISALLNEIDSIDKLKIAKALIPSKAFAWLYRNETLFALWENHLQGDKPDNIFNQIVKSPSTDLSATDKLVSSNQIDIDEQPEKEARETKEILVVSESKSQIDVPSDRAASSDAKIVSRVPDDAVIQEIDLNTLEKDDHPTLEKSEKDDDLAQKEPSPVLPAYQANDFWNWLKECLVRQDIKFNQEHSIIHGVDKGLFIRIPEAIDQFLKAQADQLGMPHDKMTLPQRIQLTKGIKKHDKLLRTEQGSRIHVYCLGDWQNRNVISGVIIPTDALLGDHPSPPINQALMLDPIDNT
jgi:hypothetical protein